MNRWGLLITVAFVGTIPFFGYANATQKISKSPQNPPLNLVASNPIIPFKQAWELIVNARKFAEAGERDNASQNLSQAEEIATQIEDAAEKDQILAQIASEYAAIAQFNRAIALTRGMNYQTYAPEYCCIPLRTEAEIAIARAYLKDNQPEAALAFVETIENPVSQSQVLVPIIAEFARSENYTKAIALLDKIEDASQKISAQYAIIKGYVNAERYSEALQFSQTISEVSDRSSAKQMIAQAAWRTGDYQQAELTIQQIETVDLKRQSFSDLAFVYAQVGEAEKARELLSNAYQLAQNSSEPPSFSYWVNQFVQIGEFAQALQIANNLENDYEQAEAIIYIAQGYANVGRYSEALELSNTVEEGVLQPFGDLPDPKVNLLNFVVTQAAKAGQDDLAMQAAKSLIRKDLQVKALQAIAREYAASDRKNQALAILSQAFEIAKTIDQVTIFLDRMTYYYESNAGLLMDLSQDYAQLADQSNAIAMLKTATISAQNFDYAASNYYPDGSKLKATTLQKIAIAYAELGQNNEAREILASALVAAANLSDTYAKVQSLSEISQAYLVAGTTESFSEILSEALQLSERISDPTHKIWALNAIAQAYAAANQTEQALEIAEITLQVVQTVDKPQRNWQMGQLAVALALADHPAIALQVADRITNKQQKMYSLADIAAKYAAAGKSSQANQVLNKLFQVADTIWDRNQRNLTLSELIRNQYIFSGYAHNDLWKYNLALTINNAITEPGLKAYNFAAIAWGYAAHNEPEQAKKVLATGLESVQAIADNFDRREMLWQLIDEAVRIGEYHLGVQVANAFAEHSYRIAALRQLAGRYKLSGQTQQANAVLSEAQTVANTIADPTQRERLLNAIAKQQSHL